MDIDRLVRRVSEQVAARPSRRGLVSAVAKLAVGASALLASLRGPGEAAAQYPTIDGSCCTGYDCGTNGKCPSGTKKRYQWFCYHTDGERHLCVDCFRSGDYDCTAVRK